MGLFNRKQPNKSSEHDRLYELGKVIKEFMTDPENEDVSISFIAGTSEGGMAFIKGDKDRMIKCYSEAYEKDESFKTVIDSVVGESDDPAMKIMKGMKPTTIDMPDGSKGIAIDPDNLTDDDIDNIVGEILRDNGISNNESKR